MNAQPFKTQTYLDVVRMELRGRLSCAAMGYIEILNSKEENQTVRNHAGMGAVRVANAMQKDPTKLLEAARVYVQIIAGSQTGHVRCVDRATVGFSQALLRLDAFDSEGAMDTRLHAMTEVPKTALGQMATRFFYKQGCGTGHVQKMCVAASTARAMISTAVQAPRGSRKRHQALDLYRRMADIIVQSGQKRIAADMNRWATKLLHKVGRMEQAALLKSTNNRSVLAPRQTVKRHRGVRHAVRLVMAKWARKVYRASRPIHRSVNSSAALSIS